MERKEGEQVLSSPSHSHYAGWVTVISCPPQLSKKKEGEEEKKKKKMMMIRRRI